MLLTRGAYLAMAPRGRIRKRLSRMDAAVDAMATLGFDERLVKITVKKLLKEYGGDELWPFIEEYSYKELIEAILRAQDQEDQTEETHKGVSSQDERAEDTTLESIIGPLGTLVDSTCNEQSTIGPSDTLVNSTCNETGNTVGETDCSEPVNSIVEPTDEELCSNQQDIGSREESSPPTAEGGRNRRKGLGKEDQPSIQKGMAHAACRDGGNSVNRLVQQGNKSHAIAPPPTSSPCPDNRLRMCSGSQVQSRRNSHASTPPPTSSSRQASNLKMSSGSQIQSQQPPKSSSCGFGNLKMSSGNQVQSRSNFHVSTPPAPTSSCGVSNLPPPAADHGTITLPSSKPISSHPPRRRFPCYGWIESDDEEDDADDFIQQQQQPMKPTTPVLQSQNSSGATTKCRKRKSRWDT